MNSKFFRKGTKKRTTRSRFKATTKSTKKDRTKRSTNLIKMQKPFHDGISFALFSMLMFIGSFALFQQINFRFRFTYDFVFIFVRSPIFFRNPLIYSARWIIPPALQSVTFSLSLCRFEWICVYRFNFKHLSRACFHQSWSSSNICREANLTLLLSIVHFVEWKQTKQKQEVQQPANKQNVL